MPPNTDRTEGTSRDDEKKKRGKVYISMHDGRSGNRKVWQMAEGEKNRLALAMLEIPA